MRCALCACWLHSSCDPLPGGGNGVPLPVGVSDGVGERVGVEEGIGERSGDGVPLPVGVSDGVGECVGVEEGIGERSSRITSGRYSDAAPSGIGAATDKAGEGSAVSLSIA